MHTFKDQNTSVLVIYLIGHYGGPLVSFSTFFSCILVYATFFFLYFRLHRIIFSFPPIYFPFFCLRRIIFLFPSIFFRLHRIFFSFPPIFFPFFCLCRFFSFLGLHKLFSCSFKLFFLFIQTFFLLFQTFCFCFQPQLWCVCVCLCVCFFPFTTIQTVNSYISALAQVRKL